MPERLMRWFRAQFVDPHTWRDVDLAHWWQMPGDVTRTPSAWLQLLVDLTSRATFSEWHEKVAVARVRQYDRQRPYVTRAVLVTVVGLALAVLGAAWWCWLMVVPAVLQVALEVYLHPFIHETFDDPPWAVLRWMRDIADEHHRTKLLNVTGVLGVLACPLNLFAVAFAPPGGDVGWVKIVGFAAAVLYVNSGLSSSFLDPANYTETSTMPPMMHWVRPYAPLLALLSVVAIVAITVSAQRWAAALVPLAYACGALSLLLGSAIRNHDRVVAAAAQVARQAVLEGRRELGRIVHDDLNGAKVAAETVRQVPGVPYRSAVDLAALEAFLTHFSSRVGLDAALMLSITDLVEKIASPYGLAPRHIRCDLAWGANIRRENHAVAVQMTTALVHNAVQAMQKSRNLGTPKTIWIDGFTTGDGHDLRYHLAVGDHLPPIDTRRWCAPGTTLAALNEWLDDTYGGELAQEVLEDGTKRVVASWRDRPPSRGWRDEDIDEEAS